MNFKEKKQRSIFLKVTFPVAVLVILEVFLLVATLFGAGVGSFLDQNAKDILHEKTLNRKNYIQSEMINRWSNVQLTVEKINEMTQELVNSGTINLGTFDNGSIEAEPLLGNVSEQMISLMRSNAVTGSFIVINTHELSENDVKNKPGLYLRDLDPISVPSVRNMDLLLERGSVGIVRKLAIATDAAWKPSFDFLANGKYDSFVYQPYMVAYNATQKANFKDYGYWDCGTVLGNDKTQVVTYSVPLMLGDGTVYGVFGVDLTVNYINSILPYNELFGNSLGSYAMIRSVDNSDEYQNMVISGMLYNREVGISQNVTINKMDSDFYKISPKSSDNGFVGSVEYLNIYSSNTPFSNTKWAIASVVKSNDLFAFSDRIITMLIVSIVLTLIFGIVGAFVISFVITKPVSRLVKEMNEANTSVGLKLRRTRIKEIDRMVSAIEVMSHDVIDSATKFSQIIKMASVKIAGFEINNTEKTLFLTDHFFDIFGRSDIDNSELTISSFHALLDSFAGFTVYDKSLENKVLYKIPSNGGNIYIMLNYLENGNRRIGLAEDVTNNMNEMRTLEYERDHDMLTGLMNRRAFYEALKKVFGNDKSVIKTTAVVMIDLDNLKMINDTYGHDCGDVYINCAAKCFVENSPKNTIVTRVSGDEFYLVFHGYDTEDEIRENIEKLKNAVFNCKIHFPNQQTCYLRVSAGIAWYPKDASDYKELLKCSDFAMYCAKRSGKGTFAYFDFDLNMQEESLVQNKKELSDIVENNLVSYHFQPIVDVKTGDIFGYEALMRSRTPLLNTPSKIMEIAKIESKLGKIEVLTWFNALREFSELVEAGLIDGKCKIFVNSISSQSLNTDEIAEIERLYGDYLANVVMEITEEEHLDKTIYYFKSGHINSWKASIALDDYGSGYNGEKALLYINPQYIKIDMDIIRDIHCDVDKQKIVHNIVSYAHERNMLIIAEGIENEEELDSVVKLGVDCLQGYYLGKPAKKPSVLDDNVRKHLIDLQKKN